MKRVLLDENLPRQLKNHFSSEFAVTSVPDLRWQSKKNGGLLAAMVTEGIGILLTSDRNLRFQQNQCLKSLVNSITEIEVGFRALAATDQYFEIDIRRSNI